MIIHILITVVFYFILMYLSVNILGFLVRGFFSNPELNQFKKEGNDFIKHEIEKFQRADKWVNITALIILIAYLYALFHFWNIGVMAVALTIMAVRYPELLWEIKHGRKSTKEERSTNFFTSIVGIVIWGMIPVLYYFIYYF